MIEHGCVAWVCIGFLWWPLRNLPQWMPNLALILFDPLRSELWNEWQSWFSMGALHGCAVVFCDDHFEIYHNECQIWHWFYLTHLDLNCEMIGNHDWTWVAWLCSGCLWWPLRNLPQWMPNLALILFNPLRSELWNDWQSWLSMGALHGCAVVFCDDHFEIYHNECQIWHWFYLTHLDLNCEMSGNHDWAWLSRMGVQWFSVMTTSKFTTMNAKFGIDSIWPT